MDSSHDNGYIWTKMADAPQKILAAHFVWLAVDLECRFSCNRVSSDSDLSFHCLEDNGPLGRPLHLHSRYVFTSGSQTEALYSIMERTKVRHPCSRSSWVQKCRLRHRKLILELAFPVMLLMCGDHVKSSVMVTPRYLPWLTYLRMWPPREYIRAWAVRPRLILIISHLDALNRIPHLAPLCFKLLKYCCSASWSSEKFIGR